MVFLREITALLKKNLLLIVVRSWLVTLIRALLFPVVLVIIISQIKHWISGPIGLGVGSPSPLLDLNDALVAVRSTHHRVVFINNGFETGDVSEVIEKLSDIVRDAGSEAQVLSNSTGILQACPSNGKGASACYGGVIFETSPDHGTSNAWNYTLLRDASLGNSIFVNRRNNDAQLYTLPLQRAVDTAIAATHGGRPLPSNVQQYPFTLETPEEHEAEIAEEYNELLTQWFGVLFVVAFVGVVFHLVGFVCSERESGITQLVEAMIPHRHKWRPQAARMLANHLTFDLVYFPSWLIMGIIVGELVFTKTNTGIAVLLHLLAGLALTSFSMLISSFFRRAQVSAIFASILVISLALACQLSLSTPEGLSSSTVTTIVTSILFPPMTYIYFYVINAYFQQDGLPIDLNSTLPPYFYWHVSGNTLFGFFVLQILFFPVIAIIVERLLWSTDSKARHLVPGSEDDAAAVRLKGVSKTYRPGFFRKKSNAVHAVSDITLDFIAGSITVLLGANGSGKTTTLKMISGLDTISQGSIEVDATGGIGICPQGNIHWPELTVYEHVHLLDRLKRGTRENASIEDIKMLIKACDLDLKMDAKAKTLSGGQMRKLQLAMMFAGGSRVCCVDEVSSGIDSLARRKIWEILLRERGSRTMLLTTHFLDEADILSDHVAILSEGRLKAEGSTVFLKQSYGGGYRVQLGNSIIETPELPAFTPYKDYSKVTYHAPSATEAASLIQQLEAHGIHDFQILGPTIEDVFLQLSDEVKKISSEQDKGQPHVIADDGDSKMTLNSGCGTGPLKQTWLMFQKRFFVLGNNYMPYAGVLIIPIIAAAILLKPLGGRTHTLAKIPCVEEVSVTVGSQAVSSHWYLLTDGFVYGPPDQVSLQNISRLFDRFNPDYGLPATVNTQDAFNDYIVHNIIGNESLYDSIGGFFLGETSPIIAWSGDSSYDLFSPFLVQNILNNIQSDTQINAAYQDIGSNSVHISSPSAGWAILIALVVSVYPGLFALYPTSERLHRVRALHYSNGIHSLPLWMGYLMFDLVWIVVASIVPTIIYGVKVSGWYHIEYLFVVFLLFGIAAAAWSYLVSLFVRSPLASFAASAGIQCLLMLLYFVSYFTTVDNAPATERDKWLIIEFFTIGLISPSAALLRAIFVSMNEYAIICRGTELASYPGEITLYGGPILYLILHAFVLMALVVWIDAGGRIRLRFRRQTITHNHEREHASHTTVTDRPELLDSRNDGLRVHHLTKAFGHNTAVEDVSFGVSQSESFALLGPNGAGKSTLISLIRGDLRPTGKGAQVFVNNQDLLAGNRTMAGNFMGVCPQFDAMDYMTLIQYLRFYARIRGVPDPEHNVQELIRAIGLEPYKNRLAPKLSGGNQRKLSFAIALVANPRVLLLDEPSSGMDAAAKRAVWRVLSNITKKRSVIVTTHSMEEADVLCQRAGIVARQMLALGTTEDLRKAHGDALYVHLIHQHAPRTSEVDMDAMREWVMQNVAHAQVEDRTYHGQLRFQVPRAGASNSAEGLTASNVFDLVERNKNQLNVSHYSITQTNLDQVFFNVVSKHKVEEEGYRAVKTPTAWKRFMKNW